MYGQDIRRCMPQVRKNVRALEIKLAAVIALDFLDSGAKLGRHVGKEISHSVGVRLEA